MFATIAKAVFIALFALVAGSYATSRVAHNFEGFGIMQVGSWISHPSHGMNETEPYSRAHIALAGRLPLGLSEGLRFRATKDDDGADLKENCTYTIDGRVASSRLWTMHVVSGSDSAGLANHASLNSHNMVRRDRKNISIVLSPDPHGENWQPLSGEEERFDLFITLYDTPVATSTGLTELVMPAIKKVRCK